MACGSVSTTPTLRRIFFSFGWMAAFCTGTFLRDWGYQAMKRSIQKLLPEPCQGVKFKERKKEAISSNNNGTYGIDGSNGERGENPFIDVAHSLSDKSNQSNPGQ